MAGEQKHCELCSPGFEYVVWHGTKHHICDRCGLQVCVHHTYYWAEIGYLCELCLHELEPSYDHLRSNFYFYECL